VLASLLLLWALMAWRLPVGTALPVSSGEALDDEPDFDAWQTAKGLAVALALLGVFLFTGAAA
jgi:hypothetical protein